MMKQVFLSIPILTFSFQLLAQHSNCIRTVRYDYLTPKLDASICIPHGNHIISIDDNVDLNNDGVTDKVVRWQSATLKDGDTVHYSVYIGGKDGKFSLLHTLSNLKPLYFSSYEAKSENKYYDSIKRKYIHATLSMVGFEPNAITLTFYVKPTLIKKLFFTYSPEKSTWVLAREVEWLAPTVYKSSHHQEFDRGPANPMKVEDFNMLKYIASSMD